MERRTRYGIFLLAFLIAGISLYGFFSQLQGGRRMLANADVRVSAAALTAAFDRNERAADSLYLYKVISVSGVLQQVVQDGPGNYIARLAGDRNGKALVDCHLDTLYQRDNAGLRTGDNVTIRGTCAGRWSNVILLQCIIEK
jgi:hypothetical protein